MTSRPRNPRASNVPPVMYIGQDGMAEPVRVRFTHVTDHHIAALTQTYAPRPLVAVSDPVQDVA